MLKYVSALAKILLLLVITNPCKGQEAYEILPPSERAFMLIQEGSEWRLVWDLTLSADCDSGLPNELQLVIRNRGEEILEGENIAFSIYLDDSIYGWGVDEILHAEHIEIQPNSSIMRVVKFDDLKFKDYKGKTIQSEVARSKLALSRWSICAILKDLYMPKPIIESNLTVFSNSLSFEPESRN